MATTRTQRALRFHPHSTSNKPGLSLTLDTIPTHTSATTPLPPTHARIRITHSGICGSDLHELRLGPKNVPSSANNPHVLTNESMPTVVGHEFSGVVAELGNDDASSADDDGKVLKVKVGDRVAIWPVLGCRSCVWCKEESYRLCPKWGFLGYSGWGGGMSEEVVVPVEDCFVLPEGVSGEVGALVEPLAVGWHAVRGVAGMGMGRGRWGVGEGEGKGETALVVGAGPIGVSVLLALGACGVRRCVVSEPSEGRRGLVERMAEEGGMDVVVVDPRRESVKEVVDRVTGGEGCHGVFECAGLQVAFDTAMECVRGKGVVVNVAVYEVGELVWKNPNWLTRNQISIAGSNVYTRKEFAEVIEAVADGRIVRPERMITGRVPLSRALEDGYEELLGNVEKHVKILVHPDTRS